MKKLILTGILGVAGCLYAQTPQDFVGNWKSDPGTPNMTRQLELDGNVIVMTEHVAGRNGGPERIIIRKYPTDGSTVTMDKDPWAGATATGKMENGVLTVDTTMANGTKWHDVWTISADKMHFTNEMTSSGGPARGGKGGEGKGGGGRTNKFTYTRQ
jgi:hypothetical protein